MKKRVARRRGSDTRLQVWWPFIAQVAAMLLALVGLYYGITTKIAVQAVLFEERTGNMKDKLDSLERNVKGLENYIIQLHQQEERPR